MKTAMIQINGVEITENLVAILKNLGLGETHNKDDKMTCHHSKLLIRINDFLIDYMTDNTITDIEDLRKISNLLVGTKALRDDLMLLDAEFNAIIKSK